MWPAAAIELSGVADTARREDYTIAYRIAKMAAVNALIVGRYYLFETASAKGKNFNDLNFLGLTAFTSSFLVPSNLNFCE